MSRCAIYAVTLHRTHDKSISILTATQYIIFRPLQYNNTDNSRRRYVSASSVSLRSPLTSFESYRMWIVAHTRARVRAQIVVFVCLYLYVCALIYIYIKYIYTHTQTYGALRTTLYRVFHKHVPRGCPKCIYWLKAVG